MKIFGLLVTRNEADRYLSSVLAWHRDFLDEVFVYDDQSTDDTLERAWVSGAMVERRTDDVPSFLEHEGQFRQAAWDMFEMTMQPEPGDDWVLVIDADEYFLAGDAPSERAALQSAINVADAARSHAVDLRIDEVFEIKDNRMWKRTDGYWSDTHAPRLLRYLPGGRIPNRKLACGSVPTYAADPVDCRKATYGIAHVGYVAEADRQAKFERYHGRPGHNPKHIDSILFRHPLLEAMSVGVPL